MNELEYNNSDLTKETFIEVDKRREDFEKWLYKYFEGWAKLQKTENGDYRDNQIHDLWQAYKSRDEELEGRKLECIDYQETIIKQQAEIKKLREDLREINCMAQDYVVGNVDIYTAMDSIVCHTEEALKGII